MIVIRFWMQEFWIDPTDKSGGSKQGKFFFLSTAQFGGLYPALELVKGQILELRRTS
ncbi:MAG: hypothetical protein AB1589_19970 [Cyanobacteriota bacterium]